MRSRLPGKARSSLALKWWLRRRSRVLRSAVALFAAASALAQPPASPGPGSDAKASAQPVAVLLRLTAQINNEVLDSPFSVHLNHNKLNFFIRIRDLSGTAGYYSPLTSGDRMAPKKPANSEDLKSGWVYVKLPPGSTSWRSIGSPRDSLPSNRQPTCSSLSRPTVLQPISERSA